MVLVLHYNESDAKFIASPLLGSFRKIISKGGRVFSTVSVTGINNDKHEVFKIEFSIRFAFLFFYL